jgi:O-antigen ligase
MYGHPNSFSGFAVGCLAFAMFLLIGLKSYLLRIGLIALIACCLIIIVTTGSRTGYLATVLGGIYFFLKLRTGKFKIILLLMIAAALTINLVPPEYKERFGSIFTGEEKQGKSSDARLQILKDGIVLYTKYPMGVGVHAFPKVRGQLFGRSQDTHNLYLEILTNLGPIGFIVFMVYIIKLIKINRVSLAYLEGLPGNADNAFLIAMCKATIGFILLRLLLGMFGMDLYEIYWWLALGITLSIAKLIHIQKQSVQI